MRRRTTMRHDPRGTRTGRRPRSSSPLRVAVAALVALGSLPLWTHLRRTPVDPYGVFVQSLDDTEADRTAVALAVARKRTHYASDRKADHAP